MTDTPAAKLRADLPWWHGNTVTCEGCKLTFPALDDVSQVVCVQGDPCAWHDGFLDPVEATS